MFKTKSIPSLNGTTSVIAPWKGIRFWLLFYEVAKQNATLASSLTLPLILLIRDYVSSYLSLRCYEVAKSFGLRE